MNSMLAAIIGPIGWERLSKAGFSRFIDDDFRPEQLTEDPRIVGVEIADPPLKENIKSLKPGDSATLRDYMRLGDNILGITISKAYPELPDMPVTIIDTAPPGVGPDDPVTQGGYFHGAHPRLELPPPGNEGYMEALHEALGHAISAIEGWPRGSSPTRAGSYEAYRNAPGERFARTMQERARMRHAKWGAIETSRRAEEAAAKGLRTFTGPSTYQMQRAPAYEMMVISPDESFKDTYMKTRQASKAADMFDTPIPKKLKARYDAWYAQLPENLQYTGDYDLQGTWLERLGQPDKYEAAQNGHLDDYGKKPNHITFSTGSKWHDPKVPERTGGEWKQAEDGSWDFYPGSGNKASDDELKTYFDKYEKGNRVHGREVRQDAKGGDGGSGTAVSETPVSDTPVQQGGPRIVINPTTFHNKKDALCVAFNEGFRVWMEANDFQPQSEPTDAQRKFLSDTAYADDELQLRRTILARIATFDTSVKDPTDDQLAETGSFLDAILESDWCKNDWERNAVSRLSQAVKASVGAEPVEPKAEPLEARPEEPLQSRAALGGGETEDEEKKRRYTEAETFAEESLKANGVNIMPKAGVTYNGYSLDTYSSNSGFDPTRADIRYDTGQDSRSGSFSLHGGDSDNGFTDVYVKYGLITGGSDMGEKSLVVTTHHRKTLDPFEGPSVKQYEGKDATTFLNSLMKTSDTKSGQQQQDESREPGNPGQPAEPPPQDAQGAAQEPAGAQGAVQPGNEQAQPQNAPQGQEEPSQRNPQGMHSDVWTGGEAGKGRQLTEREAEWMQKRIESGASVSGQQLSMFGLQRNERGTIVDGAGDAFNGFGGEEKKPLPGSPDAKLDDRERKRRKA